MRLAVVDLYPGQRKAVLLGQPSDPLGKQSFRLVAECLFQHGFLQVLYLFSFKTSSQGTGDMQDSLFSAHVEIFPFRPEDMCPEGCGLQLCLLVDQRACRMFLECLD